MISLKQGLQFEVCGSLLRWGSTRDEAWRIGKPSHYLGTDDFTRIQWDEQVLGGLHCGVLAYLPDAARLEGVHLWLIQSPNVYPNQPWFAYMRIFDHLLKAIGPPSMRPAWGSIYAPLLTWSFDGCTLQLWTGERHGDFTSLSIKRGDKGEF